MTLVGGRRGGPGAVLKRLLSTFGVVSAAGCSCDAMAAKMDFLGPEWCLSRHGFDEIAASLERAARDRGFPFCRLAARLLVIAAVHLSDIRQATPSG